MVLILGAYPTSRLPGTTHQIVVFRCATILSIPLMAA